MNEDIQRVFTHLPPNVIDEIDAALKSARRTFGPPLVSRADFIARIVTSAAPDFERIAAKMAKEATR